MPTYFGKTVAGTLPDPGNSGLAIYNKNVTYACPGSGNQTLKELSYYCDTAAGTANGKIRLAIYDAARTTLIAQGTAGINPIITTGWQGHLTQSDITPNPATLIGGVNYTLAVSIENEGSGTDSYYDTGSSGDYAYDTVVDYTASGFPASLGFTGDTTELVSIRAGVDPAPGGVFRKILRRLRSIYKRSIQPSRGAHV